MADVSAASGQTIDEISIKLSGYLCQIHWLVYCSDLQSTRLELWPTDENGTEEDILSR
jgi:hypothetical protein